MVVLRVLRFANMQVAPGVVQVICKTQSNSSSKGRQVRINRTRAHATDATITNPLQQLLELAKSRLAGGRLPTDADVQDIKQCIGCIPLEDLGFSSTWLKDQQPPGLFRMSPRLPPRSNNITYLHIHEDQDVTIGIFCLPENATIPLHNHPGMTVFSRLLFGSMHLRAYDWIDVPGQQWHCDNIKPAKLVTDRILHAPTDACVLFPRAGGNIHTFTAKTPCAILDVLSPPYSQDEGRDCHYFLEHLPSWIVDEGRLQVVDPQAWASEDILVGLEECDPPVDFVVTRGKYQGRVVNPNVPMPVVSTPDGLSQ